LQVKALGFHQGIGHCQGAHLFNFLFSDYFHSGRDLLDFHFHQIEFDCPIFQYGNPSGLTVISGHPDCYLLLADRDIRNEVIAVLGDQGAQP